MLWNFCIPHGIVVALLAEGVDRNSAGETVNRELFRVALLAEGVDRNVFAEYAGTDKPLLVALLAEGVDRNTQDKIATLTAEKSPSSRRAWIEIALCADPGVVDIVALLAEGVDRNVLTAFRTTLWRRRPPRGGRG